MDSLPGTTFIPQVTYQSEVVGQPFKLLQYQLMSCTFVVLSDFWLVCALKGSAKFTHIVCEIDI